MTPSLAYGAGMIGGGGHSRGDYEDENCRHCGASSSLWTDWSSGDVVCRECGVVAQQHVMFQGAEWREFAADMADGLGPSGGVARCDLNIYKSNHSDETGYNFGTPTTTLLGGDGLARKRLLRAHHATQHMLERQYKEQLKQEKLTMDIQENQQRELSNVDGPSHHLQKDNKMKRDECSNPLTAKAKEELKLKLAAEKWSLSIALQLHENNDNNNNGIDDFYSKNNKMKSEKIEDSDNNTPNSLETLSIVQRKCAKELYTAYSQMKQAVEMLNLPTKPIQEQAMEQLCTYVALKDGWSVPKLTHDRTLQISSIVTTFLYLACKQYGYTRTLKETCQTTSSILDKSKNRNNNSDYKNKNMLVIKPKHCSKVMKDIQQIMPKSIQNATKNPNQNIYQNNDDYVKHFCQPLKLPPNAVQTIQTCLTNYQNLQIKFGIANGVKQTSICAAMAFFVGWVRDMYSNYLSSTNYQIERKQPTLPVTDTTRKRSFHKSCEPDKGMRECNDSNEESNSTHKYKKIKTEKDQSCTEVGLPDDNKKGSQTTNESIASPPKAASTTFDIMSHEAIPQRINSISNIISYNDTDNNYPKRNLLKHENSWYRDLNQVERVCHVSRNIITDTLKQHILPHKHELFKVLDQNGEEKHSDDLLKNISETIGPLITWKSLREKVKH